MPGFFDRLKPQPKNIAPASEPVISTPVEVTKPVEVTPPVEPDFKNSQIGTPFETPIAFAQRYYEAVKTTGELTPEMQTKMAAFTEVSGILADGWRSEQEENATLEKSKRPSEKLKDALKAGIRPNGSYSVDTAGREIDWAFQTIVGGAETKLSQEKIVSDKSPEDIVADLFNSGGLIRRIDMGNLMRGYAGALEEQSRDGGFLRTEQIAMWKSLGVIPAEAPNGGSFPLGQENAYLIRLLKRDGQTTETEVKTEDGQALIEYKRPTKVEGVSAVISIRKDLLDSHQRVSNPDGYQMVNGFRLELSPEFYTGTLGIKPTEGVSVTPTEKPTE
ncbi:MAG TPA: hypothetical protein VN174_00560 [Candidatus Methanoperedens sp.]|nr:hypothetical protein [Candidatus Methanoperedens sp.]